MSTSLGFSFSEQDLHGRSHSISYYNTSCPTKHRTIDSSADQFGRWLARKVW